MVKLYLNYRLEIDLFRFSKRNEGFEVYRDRFKRNRVVEMREKVEKENGMEEEWMEVKKGDRGYLLMVMRKLMVRIVLRDGEYMVRFLLM